MGQQMTDEPKIDGRTRAAKVAAMAEAQQAAQETGGTPKVLRRKRASVGGFKQRLDAPKREGYVRRWVLNNPSRILEMEELGYQKANADIPTDGLGTSTTTRHAGKDEDGKPMHLVLMETPEAEYAVGVAEKEEGRKAFDDRLRAGTDTSGTVEGAYAPADRSSISHSG